MRGFSLDPDVGVVVDPESPDMEIVERRGNTYVCVPEFIVTSDPPTVIVSVGALSVIPMRMAAIIRSTERRISWILQIGMMPDFRQGEETS